MIHDFSSFDGHCFWFCFRASKGLAVSCCNQLVGFGLSQSLWVILLQLDCCFLSRWISYLPWTFDTLCPLVFGTHLCISCLFLSFICPPCEVFGWVSQSQIQRSLNCPSNWLVCQSLSEVLPLVLWILFVNSPPASLASHGYPAAASEASVQSLTSSGDTRASLLASFPACPAHWISRAATHLSGSQLSGAWLLGTCCVRGKSQFAKQD